MSAESSTLAGRLSKVIASVRAELHLSRHVFHDGPAYVVRDPLSFKSHSFSPVEYQVLITIDERRTLGETFALLVEEGTLEPGGEEEFYDFIVELHRMGLLSLPINDGASLYQRYARGRRASRRGLLFAFVSLRVPLVNPDRFLERTEALFRPLFTRAAFVGWLILMVVALGVVMARWGSFAQPLTSLAFFDNLAALWALLIVLKVIHEFGHAYACRVFGGHVPEMGALLIMFTPCAYVDVTDSWRFSSRRHRLIVGLAGMYFESIVGAAAVFVWAATSPGFINSLAYQAIVMSSLITIGFNANPLARFDGYYILSDLVNMPNLRQQSQDALKGIFNRVALGLKPDRETHAPARTALLALFGIGTIGYRVLLTLTICALIATKLYFVGIALATFFIIATVGGAGVSTLKYLWLSKRTASVRLRALVVGLAMLLLAPTALLIPLPTPVQADGVLGRLHEDRLRARVPGFIETIDIEDGQSVRSGDRLVQLQNQELRFELQRSASSVTVLDAQADGAVLDNAAELTRVQSRRAMALAELDHAKERVDELSIRTDRHGTILLDEEPTVGAFVHDGQPIARLVDGPWIVRVLLTASEIAESGIEVGRGVSCQLVGRPDHRVPAHIESINEMGTRVIDDLAMTESGGGSIRTDPITGEADTAFFEVVVVLDLEDDHPALEFGATVRVRTIGPSRTLVSHAYRRVTRFLNNLHFG